jgi:PhnB protein
MTKAVKPIPEGYHTLTAYIMVKGAAEAIEFYKKAFGAKELFRMPGPDGKTIGHAELQIGDSRIMLADDCPEANAHSPSVLKGTTFAFCMYVENADAAFQRAVDAGAKVVRPLADQFYGDRAGGVADPYGHQWWVMTHIEDVPPEEMKKRAEEWAKKAAQQKH